MNHSISIPAILAAAFLGGCATTPHTTALASSTDGTTATASQSEARAPRIVEGDLDITNQTSLEAFEGVEVVTGTLTVVGNTRLPNLDGLESLRAVKHLVISENLALRDIEGLSGLRHARSVTITGNPRLENLRGLDSVKKVDRLLVTKNGIFCTTGLDGLAEAGDVVISQNPRLLSLRGLENLASAKNVTITNNPRLSAESGLLDNLSKLSGKLEIRNNAGLQASDLEGVHERFARPVVVAAR
jgi:hypothetical protein